LRHLDEAFRGGKLQFFGEWKKLADAGEWRRYLREQRGRKWVVYCNLDYAHDQRPKRWSRSADAVRG